MLTGFVQTGNENMANQYQNRQSFSQVSNELLARYFEARDVDLDVGFGELTETIFETFIALPEEQHAQIGNASIIDDSLVVFNIAGNKYRLVVDVDYVRQAMFVKFVGTHAKYDKLDLKGK